MKIRVQSIHFDADQKLLMFIQEKIDALPVGAGDTPLQTA